MLRRIVASLHAPASCRPTFSRVLPAASAVHGDTISAPALACPGASAASSAPSFHGRSLTRPYHATPWLASSDATPYTNGAAPTDTAPRVPVTTRTLASKHRKGERIVMTTAYDYPTARQADEAGIDVILVGDSVGMVVLGYPDTVSVTMDDMLHHTKAVARGAGATFVVGDMPFGSYATPSDAVANAVRFLKEGRAHAVKLEGGAAMASTIRAITDAGIAVVAHIGLTPQSVSALGGYSVQGKSAAAAEALLADARAVQDAGAVAVVLEMVPHQLSEIVTRELDIPTIGIGAGPCTSGQVLVWHDLQGAYHGKTPKFVHQFGTAGVDAVAAAREYARRVRDGTFPTVEEHSFGMAKGALATFLESPHITRAAPTEAEASADVTSAAGAGAESAAPATVASTEQSAATVDVETHATSAAVPLPAMAAMSKSVDAPRVAVIGGGAMGSLFAAKLSAAGAGDVHIITSWDEHAAAVNSGDLRVDRAAIVGTSAGADDSGIDFATMHAGPVTALSPHAAVENVASGALAPFDIAIVLVKGQQTEAAGAVAASLLHAAGVAVTLQNGASHLEALQNIVGAEKVLYGVTGQAAHVVGPGHVIHAGEGPTKIVPPLGALAPDARRVVELLDAAGIRAEARAASELPAVMIEKLVINACINPLTALLRCENGGLLTSAPALHLLHAVHGEIVSAAGGLGTQLRRIVREDSGTCDVMRSSASEGEAELRSLVPSLDRVKDVARATARNTSSMLADVRRGEATEVGFINGVVVKGAEAVGVPVPVNASLVDLLSAGHAAGQ